MAALLSPLSASQHFSGVAVSGFATVDILLLMLSSIVMISLGIIGAYLAAIYDEVKRRPRYVVQNAVRVNIAASARSHGPDSASGGKR